MRLLLPVSELSIPGQNAGWVILQRRMLKKWKIFLFGSREHQAQGHIGVIITMGWEYKGWRE